jgi:DNA polymerase III delta subunit
MIFLVHGDNTTLSRKLVINQFNNKAFKSKKEIHLNDVSLGTISEVVTAQDLFGEPQFVILDVTGTKPAALEPLLPILRSVPQQNILILFSAKALPKTNILLKFANENNIKVVDNQLVPEGNIFKFVDLLLNQNRTAAYKEMDALLKDGNDPFYLFSMILYGLRNITHAVLKSEKFKMMKPYQQDNLSTRAKKTSLMDIKEAFRYIYNLDKKTKIGEMQPEMMLTLSIEKMLNF